MSSAYPSSNSSRTQQPSPRLDMDMNAYSPYSQPDSPPAEDENASLRSQALNADGTPKRPMNAFMIFARRRRPQVSAANQMMRTGEISKILSKEWNTMPMSDKQFYLDQAKKLKENFNAKYPDYVYRRRPNNSRKKRRTDAAPYDPSVSSHDYDHPHDDYDSVSPIDPHHPHHSLAPNGESVSLASQAYRLPYSTTPAAFHASDSASYHPYYSSSHSHSSHSRHTHSSAALAHYDSPGASLGLSSYPSASASTAALYPEDDPHALWPSYSSTKLEPLHYPANRRTLPPPPLPLLAHARNWSDSTAGTSSASPPSSAGSQGGFPSALGGSGGGGGGGSAGLSSGHGHGHGHAHESHSHSSQAGNFQTLTPAVLACARPWALALAWALALVAAARVVWQPQRQRNAREHTRALACECAACELVEQREDKGRVVARRSNTYHHQQQGGPSVRIIIHLPFKSTFRASSPTIPHPSPIPPPPRPIFLLFLDALDSRLLSWHAPALTSLLLYYCTHRIHPSTH
ncbi:hypothetical protein K439DRAFT_816081 [Ramaria rubella]|nr:hypothetical protein K439DRAFT_816081 [Ramaria rubella]